MTQEWQTHGTLIEEGCSGAQAVTPPISEGVILMEDSGDILMEDSGSILTE